MTTILNQYKIIRKLGRGGFGQVYLATDEKGNEWAIKEMNKKKLGKDVLSYIYNEIEVMKELDSKYIVKLFTAHESDEFIYIVLEFCNGGDIRKDMIKQPEKVYKLKEAVLILSDVIRGLEVVHKKGILHRDVKIDNILVHNTSNKKVTANLIKVYKIADFGLSTLESKGDIVLGTGSYMSPELYSSKEYGFEVDMWSFGVVFYFMLNKQFPFSK